MSWKDFHSEEVKKVYFNKLQERIDYLYSNNIQLFPPKELIYRCFEETDFNQVRVVILGQDPYHGQNQANGLAFAVNEGISLPPSLKNIVKESGCTDTTLVKWAKQGVLLLNTTLTVQESKPLSCSWIGWEKYTDNAVKYLLDNSKNPLIFCLWGKESMKKKYIINKYENAVILESSHPSPLSANKTDNPFLGCGHFDKINEILESKDQKTIEW